MSIEQTTDVAIPEVDDLDAFSKDFFGQKSETVEPKAEVEAEVADDAPTPDTQEPGDNEPADEVLEAEAVKPKSRYQERIDQLTAQAREAERQRDEYKAKAEAKTEDPKPAPQDAVEDLGPTPDDTLEDGTEKYPLGEFDPQYIRDLTKHALKQERDAMKQEDARQAEMAQADRERAELQTSWQAKLDPAKERYPDFVEKGEQLLEAFTNLQPAYAEYLTAVIMGMEHGPDVLYHLSNRPDLAKQIVSAGATKATIALGRIEAMFIQDADEVEKSRPKISSAPTPPPTNKGVAVSRPVAADTDDLDAFESTFFTKKRRKA